MENNKEYQKWLEVVEKDGMNLGDVPEELKTVELCEMAVRKMGQALEFVPEELKTLEMCSVALSQGYLSAELLEAFVPDEFHKELAEKYDIELPKKTNERGR